MNRRECFFIFKSNIRRKLRDSVKVLDLIKEMGIKYNKKDEDLEFVE